MARQVLTECGMPPINTHQEPWAVAQAVHEGTPPTDDEIRRQAGEIAAAARARLAGDR
ncbi:hypothetical protein [Nonomuraea sp. NPDC050691]|uniref:hypothetical protein n=1 Tax=Nonomuraea sp. NPDC050691 TaxID=3155661 RepID=UPI0034061FBF